ncbi:hypothetical protein [Brevibacterium pigmentatum]|uniref:hypothetical protein n=1 Tax=Brevibacterium pigmentatum TaxID=1496080 RepID=UPI001D18F0B8|nr:hypothetical protein [Brevibacterium pigmentatum]
MQVIGEIVSAAPDEQEAREQIVLGAVGDDATVADEDDEVRALVQITGDVSGIEDAAFAIVDDLSQQVEQLVACKRVRSWMVRPAESPPRGVTALWRCSATPPVHSVHR